MCCVRFCGCLLLIARKSALLIVAKKKKKKTSSNFVLKTQGHYALCVRISAAVFERMIIACNLYFNFPSTNPPANCVTLELNFQFFVAIEFCPLSSFLLLVCTVSPKKKKDQFERRKSHRFNNCCCCCLSRDQVGGDRRT